MTETVQAVDTVIVNWVKAAMQRNDLFDALDGLIKAVDAQYRYRGYMTKQLEQAMDAARAAIAKAGAK